MTAFLSGCWALTKPTNSLDFWTMVTGVGTVSLSILAYRGLKSLGLTRTGLVTSAVREARQCAIRRCEEFAEKVIPANYPILVALGKMPIFVKNTDQVRFDPDDSTHLAAAEAWKKQLPPGIFMQCTDLLNKLEAWAMYFMNGLAEHKIAFGPCGSPYCSIIVQLYPALILIRSRPSSGKYPNAVELFKNWIADLEKEKPGLIAGDLLKQLVDLQTSAAKNPAPRPRKPLPDAALGTDID